jgi:hypothetical protein
VRPAGIAAALAAGAALAAPGGDAPIRTLRWLAPGADAVTALTRSPAECLTLPADTARRLSVEVGRAAFRTPVVLGGQAARAGIACETCHRSGRTNPDFLFPGVSGAPGTADVTSSLFSTHRGDGIDNPKPIPDLGGPKGRLKIAQAPEAHALEPFIHGLITEEIDGPEPAPAVLQGLADYVRALSPQACPRSPTTPVTLAGLMDDARRALAAAGALVDRGDRPAAATLVAAARARLFLIDERYAGPALAADRERLRAADRGLGEIAELVRSGAPEARARLSAWRAQSPVLEANLARDEARSLFDRRRLAAAVQGRLPGKAS